MQLGDLSGPFQLKPFCDSVLDRFKPPRVCFSSERSIKIVLWAWWDRWAKAPSQPCYPTPSFQKLNNTWSSHKCLYPLLWPGQRDSLKQTQSLNVWRKPLLCPPSNLPQFRSYKAPRMQTDASCAHGLCLAVPPELSITLGNRAFSNGPLALSQQW